MATEAPWHPTLAKMVPLARESRPGDGLDPPKPWQICLHVAHPGPFGVGNLFPMWECAPQGPWPVPVSDVGEQKLLVGPHELRVAYHGERATPLFWTIWPPHGSEWAYDKGPGHWCGAIPQPMRLDPGDTFVYTLMFKLDLSRMGA